MLEKFSTGFYNQLKGNAALQTLLSGSAGDKKIYNILAPQTASLPYIVYGLLTDMPIGDFADPATIEDMTFYVNCFSSTSPINISQIADGVKVALDNSTLTITGYTAMKCMREFTGNINYDKDTKVFSLSLRYRVWGSK